MSLDLRKFRSWPPSISDITATDLRALTEDQFREMLRLVRKRERAVQTSQRANEATRKFVLKRRPERRSPFKSQVLRSSHRDCEFCDSLIEGRQRKWRPLESRKRGVQISCRKFSFIDDPLATIATLRAIANAECDAINFRINFEDHYVQDIGPYLVFGLMREKMAPITTGGRVSQAVIKVLESVQLTAFLRMQPFGPMHIDDVWPLPLKQRRKGGTSTSSAFAFQPTTVELTADQIVSQVNHWMGEVAQELTEYGSSKIKGMIGEVLNNAERHSRLGGDGEWIVAGFMAKRSVPDRHGVHAHVCHLCLFSPGRSVSETIAEGPDEIVSQLRRYVRVHEGRGLSTHSLSSVFALQDGISRVKQGDGNPTGGTGFMDIVEFVNEVGKSADDDMSPKVAILSGSTYIRFDAPYSRGVPDEEDGRRLQWFNQANNVRNAPDRSHVIDVPWKFPGTLITMRFALDDSLADGEPE